MDKQSFVAYIKTLGLKSEVEKAILGYVNSREFSEEVVEGVAQLLENAADQSDMAAEELDKVITVMEGVKDKLQDATDKYEEVTDAAQQKYQDDISTMLDQEMAALPNQEEKQSSPEEVVITQETPMITQESIPAESVMPVVPAPETIPPVDNVVPPAMDLSDFSPAPQEPLPPLPVMDQPMAAPMQPREAEQPSIMGDEQAVGQVGSDSAPAIQPPTF